MFALAVFCLFYAARLGWGTIEYAEMANAALRWPVAEGRVEINRSARHYQQYYVYSISGHTYYGELFEMPHVIPFYNTGGGYRNGQHILVYFDPVNPQKSSVNRILDEQRYKVNLIFACAAALVGGCALGASLNEIRDYKQRLGFRA